MKEKLNLSSNLNSSAHEVLVFPFPIRMGNVTSPDIFHKKVNHKEVNFWPK